MLNLRIDRDTLACPERNFPEAGISGVARDWQFDVCGLLVQVAANVGFRVADYREFVRLW
jgi:hypothetical protein